MNKLSKYNHFLLEKEFDSIVDDIFRIVESDGKWTGSNTYEWNLTESKLKKFLSKLSKEEIRKYFIKLLNKLKSLPDKIRRFLIINYASVFLTFCSANYLLMPIITVQKSDTKTESLDDTMKKEFLNAIKYSSKMPEEKTSFEEAQKLVKISEKGYSDDKKDRGNWLFLKKKVGKKQVKYKKFIGTNFGIAAPTLREHLGRIPTQEDMKNLSYQDAIKIFKKKYWDKQNLSDLSNQSVANIIYDGCVNQGIEKMRKVMRTVLEENDLEIDTLDNPFDDKWIQKINELDQKELFDSIKNEREVRYKNSRTFKRHGEGWMNRLNSLDYIENKNNKV